ncbi:MAG: lysylphosphatidylglycerol synthase transmembrane domain-containing protein [Bacilli bacterium]
MEDTAKKKKSKISKQQIQYLVSILIMLGVTALAVYYVLKDNISETLSTLSSANIYYILLMVGIMLISYFIEGTVLSIFAKSYKRKYRNYQGVLNGLIGSFFSSITPFASGGQFVQAYTFTKQGIKAPNAASILVMSFIVSQTSIVIMGVLAMSIGYSSTIVNMNDITLWGVTISPIAFSSIGFVISFISLGFLFFMSYSKHLHHFILNTCINIGAKLHLIREPDKTRTHLAAQVATFRIELTRLLKNFWVLVLTIILEFFKFLCWHLMPFFAGLALGSDMSGSFFKCIWSNSYLQMITSFIPIPGGSGSAEAGFQILFSSIYNSTAITSAANLLCRGITFYLTLIIGFFVFVLYKGSPKTKITNYNNRETFADLQVLYLAENKSMSWKDAILDSEITKSDLDQRSTLSLDSEKDNKKKKINWPWKKLTSGMHWKNNNFASPSDIKASFENIKKSLILQEKDIYEENDEVTKISKKYLKDVYNDIKSIAAEEGLTTVRDTEVEKAIKEDLEAIKASDKRRKIRAEKRRQKKQKKKENKLVKKEKKWSESKK